MHFLPYKKPYCGLTFLAVLTVLQAYLFLFYPVPFCLMAATVVKNVAYANDAFAMIPEFGSSSHQPDLDCQFDLANAAVSSLTEKIKSCEYYDLDKLLPINNCHINESLFIIHINIRSLNKNFDSLLKFLHLLSAVPDIICLYETKIKDENITVPLGIPNYEFIHTDCKTNAGGVAMYINSKIKFEVLQHLHLDLDNCEDLWVQLSQCKIIFRVIYRHPKPDYKLFNDSLEQNFALLQKNTFYIVGDINIDISSKSKLSNSSRNYQNMLSSHAVFPIITKQTRVTDTSATTIDHILTNDCNHSVFPGIFTTDLSDHFPVFCKIFDISSFEKPKLLKINHEIQRRDFKKFDADAFRDDLHVTLSNFFYALPDITSENFNKIFDDFTTTILAKIDSHAQVTKLSRKKRKLFHKPWITRGIFVSI